jgi:hypothetical protein
MALAQLRRTTVRLRGTWGAALLVAKIANLTMLQGMVMMRNALEFGRGARKTLKIALAISIL